MKNSEILLNWKLIPAKFILRPNRFLIKAKLNKKIILAHLPDPGKLDELLYPDANLLLKKENAQGRKTKYSAQMVFYKNILVSLNTNLPNVIVKYLLEQRLLKQFKKWNLVQTEKKINNSRFDFYLTNNNNKLILEVKSCTLVKNGIALFPDSITKRGSKHIKHLLDLKERGYEVSMLFVIQRSDAILFKPNKLVDPEFSNNLKKAYDKNVSIYAIKVEMYPEKLVYSENIPIKFD